MWAQLIKTRLKPGAEEEAAQVRADLAVRMANRSGFVQAFTMQNQKDLDEYYSLIIFDTEEHAREGEMLLDEEDVIQRVRALSEENPEYIDLNVIDEFSGLSS